ncbi:MAG: hypothetical protein JW912_04825 [Sedimentisphaerales bacterium]|nr:hypothetical protein [Sedimentisphaerales bacterium]
MSVFHGKTKKAVHIRKEFVFWLGRILIVLLILWGIYNQAGNRLLRPIARAQLEELIGGEVTIDSVDFKNNFVVRVRQFAIRPDQPPFNEIDVLQTRRVDVYFSFISLIKLQPKIKKIIIRDPVINILYDTVSNKWNLGVLDIKASPGAVSFPVIKIRDGVVNISSVLDGESKSITACGLKIMEIVPFRKLDTYNIYIECDDKFGFDGSILRGIWKKGPEGHLSLNGKILMSGSPVFGNGWDMEKVDLALEYDESDLQIKHIKWRMGDQTNIELSGSLKDYKNEPHYVIKLDLKDVFISSKPQPNYLVYSDSILSKFGEGLRSFLKRHSPRGRGDINVEISGDLKGISSRTTNGFIECKDVFILDEQFPYLLEHMTGRLNVENKKVIIGGLHSKHNKVDLNMEGFTDTIDGEFIYDIHITSSNMLLDKDLYKAISTGQKKLWFIFSPSGTAKIDQRLIRKQGKEPESYLKVDLVDIDSRYQHFPYPLKNLTGTVLFEPGRLELKEVTSSYDNKTIVLEGNVTDTEAERPRFDIEVFARNIPIDETLKQALPASQRRFYDYFDVDAMTDVDIHVFPNEVGRRLVEYIANAKIMGASVVYEKFPVPLTDVDLIADLTPDMVWIRDLTGKNKDIGDFRMSGWIWPANDEFPEMGYCLKIVADDVDLTSDLLNSLPDEASVITSLLRPRGNIDVNANINFNSRDDECDEYRIDIKCQENSFGLGLLPPPINNVAGDVTITSNIIELKELIATGPRDEASDTDIGRIVINGLADYEKGRGVTSGHVDFTAEDLIIKGKKIDILHGQFIYDPNIRAITGRDITGAAYGGKIIGDGQLNVTEKMDIDYALELLFNEFEVKDLFADINPDQQSDNAQGLMKGSLSLSGTLGEIESNTGRLTSSINDMKIAKRSLLGKTLTALQLNNPTDFKFNDVTMDAYIRGKKLFFEKLYISGKGIVLQGKGSLDLKSDIVDLDFTASGSKITSNPSMLESLAKGLGPTMVKVKIYGPTKTAQISTEVPMIQNPLDLLGTEQEP